MVPRIPFDVDKLRADIEAGRTLVSIAAEYNCSQRAVQGAMRREGITRPERHLQARHHPELVDRAWLQREYVGRKCRPPLPGRRGRQLRCPPKELSVGGRPPFDGALERDEEGFPGFRVDVLELLHEGAIDDFLVALSPLLFGGRG